ncbi:MAG: alpha/beta fold hydrolase [Streptosporangiaceae bacterium]
MTQDQRFVSAGDGRSLEVLVTGPPDGLPVLFHHGTPGGVALYQPMVTAAADRGLRLVLYGRPGYGSSTPQPGRRVADAAADVAAILDGLGAGQFVTVGWSGGGPHALACARLLAGRCLAAATLGGVAPYPADGLDWLAGMAADNVAEFGAALAGEQDLTTMLAAIGPALRDITADQLVAGLGDLASASDKEALHGELADWIVVMFRAGLQEGIAGWRDDDLALTADWGFPVAGPGAATPVSVWQGDQDQMVPFAHGQWLATTVPAARSHLIRGVGHMNLPFGAVFDELLELARR